MGDIIINAKRYLFLDRDGTIIRERHYLSDPNEVELLPNAARGLRCLQHLGFGLVIVTNQSAIGRGFFDEERLAIIHERMLDLLKQEDVTVDGLYYCPHIPADLCSCRKPETGLFIRASKELAFDLRASFTVGDKPCDIEVGRRIGSMTFLVRTGYGAEYEAQGSVSADYCVDDLYQMFLRIKSFPV